MTTVQHELPIRARYAGTCARGRHPFTAGALVVPEIGGYACLDCAENGILPPAEASPEDLLDHAHEAIRSICRAAGDPDLDRAVEEVRRLAAHENLVLNAGRDCG